MTARSTGSGCGWSSRNTDGRHQGRPSMRPRSCCGTSRSGCRWASGSLRCAWSACSRASGATAVGWPLRRKPPRGRRGSPTSLTTRRPRASRWTSTVPVHTGNLAQGLDDLRRALCLARRAGVPARILGTSRNFVMALNRAGRLREVVDESAKALAEGRRLGAPSADMGLLTPRRPLRAHERGAPDAGPPAGERDGGSGARTGAHPARRGAGHRPRRRRRTQNRPPRRGASSTATRHPTRLPGRDGAADGGRPHRGRPCRRPGSGAGPAAHRATGADSRGVVGPVPQGDDPDCGCRTHAPRRVRGAGRRVGRRARGVEPAQGFPLRDQLLPDAARDRARPGPGLTR